LNKCLDKASVDSAAYGSRKARKEIGRGEKESMGVKEGDQAAQLVFER
jgi:hypothetical protein